MSEKKNTPENETRSEASEQGHIDVNTFEELITNLPNDSQAIYLLEIILNQTLQYDPNNYSLIEKLNNLYKDLVQRRTLGEQGRQYWKLPDESGAISHSIWPHATILDVINKPATEKWSGLAKDVTNFKAEIISFSINIKPLTPQTLAFVFNALTELTTKLWLIAHHRFADLIEYTQTHDIRFADEAGSTIAWATYNSPFSFGLQVDKVVPGIADAIVTIVDGLSQRKAKQLKLEIDNLGALMATEVAEQQLKQQKDITEFERQQQEIKLEKQRLENERERQRLVEQRLESRIKQIDIAVQFAGMAIDTVYPNADPEMRPILMQTLVNNILQLDSVEGLQLLSPEQSSANTPKQEDTDQ